jgi:SAM-dependent methyltransferase
MAAPFRRSVSSATCSDATSSTTIISACIRRLVTNRPLTMNTQPRRTHVSTEPREDPGRNKVRRRPRVNAGVRPIPGYPMDASQILAAEYSEKSAAYARHWSPVIRPMAQPLLPALPLRTAGRVLDVGTGTGAFLVDLKTAAPEAMVIGVDRAEGMVRVAKQSGHLLLTVADAQRLGIRSGTIDVVVMIFVLFHLPEPSLGLCEVHRVLREGGTVGIVTWGQDPGSPGLSIWKEELDWEGAAPDPRDPSVMQQASMDTPEKLQHLLHAGGFVSVNVWSATATYQWTVDNLLAMQVGCGMPARRLASLSSERQEKCQSRVRTRLGRLTPTDLEYCPEVLLAVGGRPNTALEPTARTC